MKNPTILKARFLIIYNLVGILFIVIYKLIILSRYHFIVDIDEIKNCLFFKNNKGFFIVLIPFIKELYQVHIEEKLSQI